MSTSGLETALSLVAAGTMRIDAEQGMVYRTFVTTLYSYERPVGGLKTNGYVAISLGRGCEVSAHRLIWAHVNGTPPVDKMINHRNGIKHDNRIANLELVTAAENIQHGYDTGLIPSGENHPLCKLKDAQVIEIRALAHAGSLTQREIGARFGVSRALVSVIKTGRHR